MVVLLHEARACSALKGLAAGSGLSATIWFRRNRTPRTFWMSYTSPWVRREHEDQIIQVLAGANLHSTRKFADLFELSHRTMRGRAGVQSDLRWYTGALHRATEKRFGGVDIPVPAENMAAATHAGRPTGTGTSGTLPTSSGVASSRGTLASSGPCRPPCAMGAKNSLPVCVVRCRVLSTTMRGTALRSLLTTLFLSDVRSADCRSRKSHPPSNTV